MKRLFIALDVDCLVAIAQGVESALEAVDIISKLGGYPTVTPSVYRELQDQAEKDSVVADRRWAQVALRDLATWGVIALEIDGVERDIVEVNCRKLICDGLDGEEHLARILMECAATECRLLLTYRDEMFKIDFRTLKIALLAAHLTDCIPVSPDILVSVFNTPPGESGKPAAAS